MPSIPMLHPCQKQTRFDQRGFTLIEAMIALTVITVAVYLLSSTITATMSQSTARKQRTMATEAAMNVLEGMRAVPFKNLYAMYNQDPADDPDGPGTAPGPTFQVAQLSPRAGAPNGAVGYIIMPEVDGQLRENMVQGDLGMPRDLNGDLIVDSADHAESYMIMPIQVRLEWASKSGEGSLNMSSMFSAVQKHLQ